MTKSLLYVLMLVCSIGVLTSCGDDNKKGNGGDIKYPIEKELAGSYIGEMSINVNSEPVGTSKNQKITINKSDKGDNLVDLSVKNFNFMINVGDIEVSYCELNVIVGGYSFKGNGKAYLPDPMGECPIAVSGTIKAGNIHIEIGVEVGKPLDQIVDATFEGHKMNGKESSEALIKKISIESDKIAEQPVIDNATGTVLFRVTEETTDLEKTFSPVIEVSEGAVVTPGSGMPQDFSNNKSVTYTVTAADGTTKAYTVSSRIQSVLKFSFEDWVEVKAIPFVANRYDKPQPINLLATSAEGAAMLKFYGFTNMPVYKTDDKKEGEYAIKLVTMDTSAKADKTIPAITSGSLFTGKFDTSFLSSGKLYCTRFGVPYDKVPLTFSGWYKYAPGKKFIDGTDYNNIFEVVGKIDECAIQAILYKVENADDVLTGVDINDSKQRVAVAALTDGTAKDEYTYFELPFKLLDGMTYETGVQYKLAIVCSSSKEGDSFKGAGGSTLILDELQIIGDK